MKKIRKNIVASVISCSVLQQASAVTGASVISPFGSSMCEIFGKLIPTAIALMIAAYAALLWVYSREDPAMRERAKHMLILVFAGMILVNLAKPIAKMIFGVDICP